MGNFPLWRLVVRAPAGTVLDVQGAKWVEVPLADGGPIRILPGHAPLLAETLSASLRYLDEVGEHSIYVQAGVLFVSRGQVAVFTNGPMHAEHEKLESKKG